jgi:hypothetical protein
MSLTNYSASKRLLFDFDSAVAHDDRLTVDHSSLAKLRALIMDAYLILETSPDLPPYRTANCREILTGALVLADDLLKQVPR